MLCISTVKYSLTINGSPEGCIQPTRGIRQGDRLSLYIFILCTEALSTQFGIADQTGSLRGVPTSPKGPRLNHLFFVDNSILFCKVTPQDWHQLITILEGYERASGQRLKRDKTSIFFSAKIQNTTLVIVFFNC
jgi:hypothetical protein